MSDVRAELRSLVDDITAAGPGPEALWDTLTDLGLHTVGVPEEHGGSGGDLGDLATVVRALARRAGSAPLAEHAVAAWALAAAGAGPRDGLLTVAVRDDDGGPVTAVPWGRDATRVVLIGPGDRAGVATLGPGVTVTPGTNTAGEPRDTVDLGESPVLELPGVSGDLLRARIGVLRAAALAGACAGAYELTRTYVRDRHQFGRPLLDIPAVSAALATAKVACLQADAAVERALDLHAGDGPAGDPPGDARAGDDHAGRAADLLAATAVARVVAGEAAGDVARIAHQLHGAMGVTREYPLHPLTTRLWAWRDEDGDEERWAGLLGSRAADHGEPDLWDRLTA